MSNEIFEPYGTPKLKIYLKYGIFNGRFMWNCRLSPPHFHSPINQSTWRDLLSVLSKPTLQFIFNLGLTQARVQSPTEIIDKLREHCSAGRNRHTWRLQFASMKQRENQSVDKWLNEVRIIAHKCEFASDCCSRCGPIRILEKFISGLFDDDLRRKFQYQDCALEDVLNTLSAVEMALMFLHFSFF